MRTRLCKDSLFRAGATHPSVRHTCITETSRTTDGSQQLTLLKQLCNIYFHPFPLTLNAAHWLHHRHFISTSPPWESSETGTKTSSKQQFRREMIEDSVMAVLCHYTKKPLCDLELTTRLTDLETVSGHDSSLVEFSTTRIQETGSPSMEPSESMISRRLWDCLDTVEFMLDVERCFDLEIPDAMADGVETPEDAVNVVYELLLQKGKIDLSPPKEKSLE